jgi:hypothetical protein
MELKKDIQMISTFLYFLKDQITKIKNQGLLTGPLEMGVMCWSHICSEEIQK